MPGNLAADQVGAPRNFVSQLQGTMLWEGLSRSG